MRTTQRGPSKSLVQASKGALAPCTPLASNPLDDDPWPLWAFARHRSTEAPMRKQGRSESTSPVNQQGQCGRPSQSPLIVFKHRGPDGQWALFSRNNRRLFALKMYQAVRGDVLVEVPCCIYATNDPNTFTFVLHHCRHFEAQRALLQEAARVSR